MENKLNMIPFMFEKNIGQHNNEVRFVLKNNSSVLFFTKSELVFALLKTQKEKDKKKYSENKITSEEYEVNLFKIMLENSNQNPMIVGEDEFDCKISYFKGEDSDKWITNIPIYEKLIYHEVYPGIDLVYYEKQGILEHDFIIKPNADIDNIKLCFEGIDKLEEDIDGNILIYVRENTVKIKKPKSYQQIDNQKVEIESSFIIDGDGIKFDVPNYDKSKVLVVDPPILYGTYLGGYGEDTGYGVAVDTNQNAYISGWTISIEGSQVKNAYQSTLKVGQDAFLIKLDTKESGATSLKYGTYLGGNNIDAAYGIAVDSNENAYITGNTNSTSEFPLKNAYQAILKGVKSAFLIKLDTKESGATSLKYGTYLGGDGFDLAYGVAVDIYENAYITGQTNSTSEFPLKNAYQTDLKGGVDSYLIKIDTKESGEASLKYGTYLGGTSFDGGYGVAVDIYENAYITGYTTSKEGFPLKNAYQTIQKGESDAFLIKINTKESGDTSLKYGTYLGGNGFDIGYAVATSVNGSAYITGYTTSKEEFPLKNAYQTIQKGESDAFLIKIDANESGEASLKYGTCLGGNNVDIGYGVAVDIYENAYITGYTTSTEGFPLKYQYQGTLNGTRDAYIIKIDVNKSGESSIKYGTYLGGSGIDSAYGIAVDTDENVYITGYTTSEKDFPLKDEYQATLNGEKDAFLIKLNTLVCDLWLEESVYSPITYVGEPITYMLKVINHGPDKATNLVVTNYIDKCLEVNSHKALDGIILNTGNRVVWEIEELNPGQSTTAMLVATPYVDLYEYKDESGIYVENTSILSCDSNLLNTSIIKSKTLVYAQYKKEKEEKFSDLIVKKCSSKFTYKVDEEIRYKIKIKNNGPDEATNVLMTDKLDNIFEILSFKSQSGTIENRDNLIIWRIDKLVLGEEVIVDIKVKVKENISNIYIYNTASIKSDSTSVNPENTIDTEKIYIKSNKHDDKYYYRKLN